MWDEFDVIEKLNIDYQRRLLWSLNGQFNAFAWKLKLASNAHADNMFSLLNVGGRDRRGGPILIFPGTSNLEKVRIEDIRRLVFYLSTIPR